MNTKVNPLFGQLVRQEALKRYNWIHQINTLASLIKPRLPDLTLGSLWDLPVVHTPDCTCRNPQKLSEFSTILLGPNDEMQNVREKQLETRAIFPIPSTSFARIAYTIDTKSELPKTMYKAFWGLTRTGQWIAVRIDLRVIYGNISGINRHLPNISVEPESVTVTTTTLDEKFFDLIRSTPRVVYLELSDSMSQLIQRRKETMEKLLVLERQIEEARSVLIHIPTS